MSEIAKNEYGDVWTAFEIKDEYLRNGTEFKWFVCAFCDTGVSPAATYGDEFRKAPYFTLKEKSRPHADACPYGKATPATYGIKRTPAPKSEHEFEVDLPERLVPIRAQGEAGPGPADTPPNQLAGVEEISRRVRTGAASLKVANQYTTALLQTLAAARASALDTLYGKAKAAGKDAKEQAAYAFRELKKYPLNLYGKQSDYHNAFRKANREPWRGEFIYFGYATVSAVATGFELSCTERINVEESGAKRPVTINIACDKAKPVNRMEACTIDLLTRSIESARTVRWYAYGELTLNAAQTAYELAVREPAHIYVKMS